MFIDHRIRRRNSVGQPGETVYNGRPAAPPPREYFAFMTVPRGVGTGLRR
jgi:hypothetical protein